MEVFPRRLLNKHVLCLAISTVGYLFPNMATAFDHRPDYSTFDIGPNTQAGFQITWNFEDDSVDFSFYIDQGLGDDAFVSLETSSVSFADISNASELGQAFLDSELRIQTTFDIEDNDNLDLDAELFFETPLLDFSRCRLGACVSLEESVTPFGLTLLDYEVFFDQTGLSEEISSDIYDFRNFQLLTVSEPNSLVLIALSLTGLSLFRIKKELLKSTT